MITKTGSIIILICGLLFIGSAFFNLSVDNPFFTDPVVNIFLAILGMWLVVYGFRSLKKTRK